MVIKRSDGSILLEIGDKQINNSDTPLSLLGRGAIDYSSAVAQNFVFLLENFASATPPNHPMLGQLWFDAGNNLLRLFDKNGNWAKATGITSIGATGLNGITVTGGPITSSGNFTITLNDSGATAGYYTCPTLTIDSTGRILSIANGPTTQTGAVQALYMRSPQRVWKIEIDDQGNFIKTPMS